MAKRFSDLGIKLSYKSFDGDKIKVDRVLNKEITVLDFRIEKSKYPEKGNPECLYMHIAIENERHVLFTGSRALQEAIKQVQKEDFPFTTTIVRENNRLEFT